MTQVFETSGPGMQFTHAGQFAGTEDVAAGGGVAGTEEVVAGGMCGKPSPIGRCPM